MSDSMQWIETMDLNGPTNAEDLSPENPAELEKKMYEAALLSVKEGYRRLAILKVPASRRPDYYAEMLKDDKQMSKIRSQLVVAQQKIEAVESRKKKQAQRKFAKQMRAAKIEKKKQEKIAVKLAKPSMKTIDKKAAMDGDGPRGRKGPFARKTGGRNTGRNTGRNAGRPKSKFDGKLKKVTYPKSSAKKGGKFGKNRK